MSPEQASAIQAIASILSGAAAIVAIWIAVQVERKTNERFAKQLEREEVLAEATIRPLLSIYASKFLDTKAITLRNYGLGTAIITSVLFTRKDGKEEKMLVTDLFDFPRPITWDYYWRFREKRYYLAAGEKLTLAKLTAKGLAEDGMAQAEITRILESLQQQMDGLKIQLEYQDVLGNQQEPCEVTLTG